MTHTTLYVDKGTDQMRATLTAYGLAHLLYQLDRPGTGVEVRLHDVGSAYQLEVNRSPDDLVAYVADRGLPILLPAIRKPPSASEKKRLEQGVPPADVFRKYIPPGFPHDQIVDYGQEREKEQESRRAKRRKTREEGDVAVRPPEYPLWAHLCSYFGKGSAMRTGYPLVVHAWYAHQGVWAVRLLELILAAYSQFPNAIEAAQRVWGDDIKPQLAYSDFEIFGWDRQQTEISALSVVSPTTAQGSSTATGARGINTNTPDIFWLEMYLAFAGYMVAGMPFNAGSDVLLYYPLPSDISFAHVQGIAQEYRKSGYVQELYDYSNLFPRAKIDILSQIAFYISMIEHFLHNMIDPDAPPWEQVAQNAIGGLVGYYYKDISTQIPFDETTFALPAWLPLEAHPGALEAALSLLEAHRKLIAAIRGDHADELAILAKYRHFIVLGDVDDWIEFAIIYSQYRFSKMVDAAWIPILDLELLEKTLMNSSRKNYRPILENPGFRNIAFAIRHCTVQTRYWKDVKKQQISFKVRHGLGDDLRRRAHNADHFIVDLSDFVYDYLRESSNVQANTGETRPFITDEDIADVVALIEEYGSRVVANLLVATGYASIFVRKSEEV